ncbi:MAG: exonuclease domain-containing protein [Bacteroidia bacterium]
MKLKLNKPIVFFDLETTGLVIGHDRIVEIALHKIEPNGKEETKVWRVNPEIPISEESISIHGITNEAVADCKTLKELAPQIVQFIGNADLAGFNSNKFDVPMLVEELLRAEVEFDIENRKLVDVQNIFHFMEPRNLAAAYKFYCGKELINAHSAEADTIATYEILKAQIERYQNTEIEDRNGKKVVPVENDVNKLSQIVTTKNRFADLAGRLAYNDKNEIVFNFGKHKDKTVVDVLTKEPSYYTWMMNGDFPLHTKRILTKIRLTMKTK